MLKVFCFFDSRIIARFEQTASNCLAQNFTKKPLVFILGSKILALKFQKSCEACFYSQSILQKTLKELLPCSAILSIHQKLAHKFLSTSVYLKIKSLKIFHSYHQ